MTQGRSPHTPQVYTIEKEKEFERKLTAIHNDQCCKLSRMCETQVVTFAKATEMAATTLCESLASFANTIQRQFAAALAAALTASSLSSATSASYQHVVANMGGNNVEAANIPVEQVAAVPQSIQVYEQRLINDSISGVAHHIPAVEAPVRQDAGGSGYTVTDAVQHVTPLHSGIVRRWCSDPYQTSTPGQQGTHLFSHGASFYAECSSIVAGVENGFTMGRCSQSHAQQHIVDQGGRDYHQMGSAQDDTERAPGAKVFHGRGWAGSGPHRNVSSETALTSAPNHIDNRPNHATVQVPRVHSAPHGTLGEAWRADVPNPTGRPGVSRSSVVVPNGEACASVVRHPVVHTQVPGQSGGSGAYASNTRSYHPIVGHHFKRSVVATQEDRRTLPLHVARVSKIDYQAVIDMASAQQRDLLRNLIRFVNDPLLYQDICAGASTSRPISRMSTQDLSTMLQSQNFEVIQSSKACRLGKAFDRPEREKGRRRLLYWPQQLNQEIERTSYASLLIPMLADASVHARLLKPNEQAATFDLAKSFLQCPLHPHVRPYFAFRNGGKYYQLTSMPIVATFAPAVMHAITTVLADTGVPDVQFQVHIDNVRFHGPPQAVSQAILVFRQRVQKANATLKTEPCNQLHEKGTFLGAQTDYSSAAIRVSKQTIETLRREAGTLDNPQASVEDFQVLFGLTLFAARVLRVPMAQFYPVVKFIRRRLSTTPPKAAPTTLAHLWPSIKPEWNHLISQLLDNPWTRHVAPQHHELVLITDASITGWGAILFDEDTA